MIQRNTKEHEFYICAKDDDVKLTKMKLNIYICKAQINIFLSTWKVPLGLFRCTISIIDFTFWTFSFFPPRWQDLLVMRNY